MADDVKKVRYVIRGEVPLSDAMPLNDALAAIRAIVALAEEHAAADVQVSVPRLTKVKL